LAVVAQLSDASATPSSGSHASPCASPSRFAWPGFEADGQLSHTLPRPSPSLSAWSALVRPTQLSRVSLPRPSWSASGSSVACTFSSDCAKLPVVPLVLPTVDSL
jgi:hypothetical protein